MKKVLIVCSVILILSSFAISCGKKKPTESIDKTKISSKELYTCPMHPYEVSEKPGKCPECGMNLEKIDTSKHSKMMKNFMKNDKDSDTCDYTEGNMSCCIMQDTASDIKSTPMGHKLYACPMHEDQLSIKPGKCPECNMDMKEIDMSEYKKKMHMMAPDK